MSDVAEALKMQIAALPVADQEDLAQFLWNTLAQDDSPDDDAFEAELDRRLETITSGKDPGIDGEEFLAQLRRKYP